jgi:hypothetical protein
VNGELDALRRALPAAMEVMAVGGRIVVLAYHSLKTAGQAGVREARRTTPPPAGTARQQAAVRILTRARAPGGDSGDNLRAASARLRAAERIGAAHERRPRGQRAKNRPRGSGRAWAGQATGRTGAAAWIPGRHRSRRTRQETGSHPTAPQHPGQPTGVTPAGSARNARLRASATALRPRRAGAARPVGAGARPCASPLSGPLGTVTGLPPVPPCVSRACASAWSPPPKPARATARRAPGQGWAPEAAPRPPARRSPRRGCRAPIHLLVLGMLGGGWFARGVSGDAGHRFVPDQRTSMAMLPSPSRCTAPAQVATRNPVLAAAARLARVNAAAECAQPAHGRIIGSPPSAGYPMSPDTLQIWLATAATYGAPAEARSHREQPGGWSPGRGVDRARARRGDKRLMAPAGPVPNGPVPGSPVPEIALRPGAQRPGEDGPARPAPWRRQPPGSAA